MRSGKCTQPRSTENRPDDPSRLGGNVYSRLTLLQMQKDVQPPLAQPMQSPAPLVFWLVKTYLIVWSYPAKSHISTQVRATTDQYHLPVQRMTLILPGAHNNSAARDVKSRDPVRDLEPLRKVGRQPPSAKSRLLRLPPTPPHRRGNYGVLKRAVLKLEHRWTSSTRPSRVNVPPHVLGWRLPNGSPCRAHLAAELCAVPSAFNWTSLLLKQHGLHRCRRCVDSSRSDCSISPLASHDRHLSTSYKIYQNGEALFDARAQIFPACV